MYSVVSYAILYTSTKVYYNKPSYYTVLAICDFVQWVLAYEVLNSIFRYLDDLLNSPNPYFEA